MKKIVLLLFFLIFSKAVNADEKMALGLEVFNNKAQCGVCHTLKAAESDGQIGPNLDLLNAKEDQIILVVTNGIGVMQAWKGILTDKEIDAVAYYVSESTKE